MRGKLRKIVVILFCIISVFSVFAGVKKLVRHVKSASNDSYISGCGMVPDYSRSSLSGDDEVSEESISSLSGDEKVPKKSASYLSGDVKVLKEKRKGFVMQITVENKGESGEDFTGIVQMIFANPHSGYYTGSANCAYNTEMTLEAKEKKQFTITVPDFTVEHQDGFCALNFIDEDGNVIQNISQYKVFDYPENKEIQVGVLSDNFEGLHYISANEYPMTVYNSWACTLKPVNLNNDNIKELLDEFYFLIIDQFDVSLLSEENIQAVQDWVKAGGWLIIGTGEYAEQTLSGFDKDFIDVDILGISEPGEENIISENTRYMNRYKEIDFTNMVVVDLKDRSTNGYFYVSPYHPAICSSIGDGAVMIFNCSLGEDELQKLDIYAINDIYEEVMDGPTDYRFEDYSDFSEQLFDFMDRVSTGYITGNTKEKTNDLTEETRVYSVTTQRVDGNRADTYLLANRDDTNIWEIRLKDNYEMASPGSCSSGFTDGTQVLNTDDYFYIVNNDNNGLSVGLKPGEYLDGFFFAEGRTESKGAISCKNLTDSIRYSKKDDITITNETDFDMAYMAVWFRSRYFIIFSDVKAGETLNLKQAIQDERYVYEKSSTGTYKNLFSHVIPVYDKSSDMKYEYKLDDMAALLVGLGIAENEKPKEFGVGQAIIVGLVKDYDKVIDDDCNETSYGCFYTYAKKGEE